MEQVGKILKPHGYKGDLTVFIDLDRVYDPLEIKLIHVDHNGMPVPFMVEHMAPKGKGQFKVKFSGVDSESAALNLVKKSISVDDEFLMEDEEDSIIGFAVIDKTHGMLGHVEEVIDIPNNSLLRVVNNEAEVLIPDNDDVILEVDEEKETVLVDCPPGLLDLNS